MARKITETKDITTTGPICLSWIYPGGSMCRRTMGTDYDVVLTTPDKKRFEGIWEDDKIVIYRKFTTKVGPKTKCWTYPDGRYIGQMTQSLIRAGYGVLIMPGGEKIAGFWIDNELVVIYCEKRGK